MKRPKGYLSRSNDNNCNKNDIKMRLGLKVLQAWAMTSQQLIFPTPTEVIRLRM